MTFNQLRTFVEVATAGSVIEAARNLVVSPPAVSAAVGAIERELGVELVERAGRGHSIGVAPGAALRRRFVAFFLSWRPAATPSA